MSMEELFGSGSDSDLSEDGGGKFSTGDDNDNKNVEDLPSTQAHMDELFGEESDAESDQSKQASSGESNNSSPGNNSDAEENQTEPQEMKNDEDAQNSPTQENNQKMYQQLSYSSEDEVEKKSPEESMPTTKDLFGEESSDNDDNEDVPKVKKPSPSQEVKEETSQDKSVKNDLPPTPEKDSDAEDAEEEGLSISIELPRCNIALGKELYFIKLPNFLSVDTKPFDNNLYEDEIEEDEILDEEGRARLKLKVENTIRWRYSKDKDGNEIKESNCRFVRWSDGSLSMHLGNEVFDVFKMPVQGEQNHLFVQQGTGLQAQAVFKNKLTFRPHSTTSQTHRKMTMSIADRMSKAQKIKMMPATERDPETQRTSLIKKEDERLRAASRRESQQRRIRDRNHLKGLSSNYLDQDMDDEEDFDTSLSAITNKYKQDVKNARSKPMSDIYSDDEDSEKEKKLRKAKLDIDSDDEDDLDDEVRQKREELMRKKKSSRKVIEESEEEDASD